MTNRLVLNLSHTANAREDSEFRSQTGLEPPLFAVNPVLGNIGASIRTVRKDLDFFDDERTGEGDVLNVEDESVFGSRPGDLEAPAQRVSGEFSSPRTG